MLALLLTLVPAPKAEPPPPHPLVGHSVMHWGSCIQECRWDADGAYDCPAFGGLDWCADDADPAVVWFRERDGAATYGMRIDWAAGAGVGWPAARPDETVAVTLARRERLRMPRGAD